MHRSLTKEFEQLLADIKSNRYPARHLSLNNLTLTSIDAMQLADALSFNHYITSLDLASSREFCVYNGAHNNIGSAGATALASLPGLKSLNLYRNGIDDACIDSLCANKSLQYLDLTFNEITDEGAQLFNQADQLTSLHLMCNDIGIDTYERLSSTFSDRLYTGGIRKTQLRNSFLLSNPSDSNVFYEVIKCGGLLLYPRASYQMVGGEHFNFAENIINVIVGPEPHTQGNPSVIISLSRNESDQLSRLSAARLDYIKPESPEQKQKRLTFLASCNKFHNRKSVLIAFSNHRNYDDNLMGKILQYAGLYPIKIR